MSAVTEARSAAQADRAAASAAARAARTRLLLEGPVGPTLARLAAPNVLAMFTATAMNIAEGWFAGRLGVTALAGLALVFPLAMLTQMLSAGAMGGAISAAVARALGAGKSLRAARVAVAAALIALGLSLCSFLLVALFGRAFFGFLGGGEAAVDAAMDYAWVYFAGCAAVWLCNGLLSVLRGSGDMGTPSLVLLLVSLGVIPIGGALSLGWGPFPALGMMGLGAAMVISNGLGAVVAVVLLLGGRAGLDLRGALRLPKREDFSAILDVGVIASLNAVQTVATSLLMVALVAGYGEAALAGYGLGARFEFMLIPIVFGVGAALTAMVGANIGAGDRARALRIAWTGAFAAAAILGALGALLALAPGLWLGLFLAPDEPAWAVGESYFRAVAPCYAGFGLGLALYFASQGAARMAWPVIGSCLRMATAFGGALLLTRVFGMGVEGVFYGVAASLLVYGGVTALAIRLGAWR